MTDQLHVEMSSEGDEDEEYWDYKSSGDPGCEMRLEGVKLDPAQNTDLWGLSSILMLRTLQNVGKRPLILLCL